MRPPVPKSPSSLYPKLAGICAALFAAVILHHGAYGARTVRVGAYDNPPKISVDGKGAPSGIFIDILAGIAAVEGWELEYVSDTWEANLERLKKGRIDLMPDMAYSEQRKQLFDFNRITVLPSWIQVYARRGNSIMSFADLNGKKIAVLEGSYQQQFCGDLRDRLKLRFELVGLPGYRETVASVESGRTDALVVDRFHAYARKSGKLEPTPVLLNISTLHFAAPRGKNRDLLAAIDTRLAGYLNDSGSVYYRSLEQWIHREPRFFIPRYLIWALAGAGMVLVLLLGVTTLLRRQVNTRTLQLSENNRKLWRAVAEVRAREDRLKSSLDEKERLLHELHHRINNNLSVIRSLLSIKAKMTGDPVTVKFADDMEGRIFSIALVHRLLYRSDDLSSIDIKNYIEEFVTSSIDSREGPGERIACDMNLEPVKVIIDTAVPFGIVLNELVSNSLRHGFPGGAGGTITISLTAQGNGHIRFEYADNGAGVPAGFDFRGQMTFGLPMVYTIVEKQMKGAVEFTARYGISCVMEFPSTLYTRRI